MNLATRFAPLGVLFLLASTLAGCGASGDGADRSPSPRAEPERALPRAFTVKVTGSGRPIIFIPGLASSGETWDSTVDHLRDRYACHVVTLAGFAGVPPIGGPLLSQVRDQLAAYIAERRLDRPVVVGHSLGGLLALDLAVHHGDRIGPLVVVDALPFWSGAMFQVDSLAAARPMIDQARARLAKTDAEYRDQTRAGLWTRRMVASDADHQRIVAWGLASDRETVNRALIEIFSADLRAELADIASPTLIVGTWIGMREQLAAAGVADPRAAAVRTFEQQFARLPRTKLAITDTARHFVMFDDPKWFFAQLDAFLANPAAVEPDRAARSGT